LSFPATPDGIVVVKLARDGLQLDALLPRSRGVERPRKTELPADGVGEFLRRVLALEELRQGAVVPVIRTLHSLRQDAT
jgi:hypothetical protein